MYKLLTNLSLSFLINKGMGRHVYDIEDVISKML